MLHVAEPMAIDSTDPGFSAKPATMYMTLAGVSPRNGALTLDKYLPCLNPARAGGHP